MAGTEILGLLVMLAAAGVFIAFGEFILPHLKEKPSAKILKAAGGQGTGQRASVLGNQTKQIQTTSNNLTSTSGKRAGQTER